MKNQHTFPQRVGKLIEEHIIKTEQLYPNKRQYKYGYYDAYYDSTIYEIKAAKEDNYFRIIQKNHDLLLRDKGSYIFVRYSLKDNDKDLRVSSDIQFGDIRYVACCELRDIATVWLEDQRKKNMYYKVKI